MKHVDLTVSLGTNGDRQALKTERQMTAEEPASARA